MLSLSRSSLAALAIAALVAGPFAALADTTAPTVVLSSTAPDPTGDNPIMFTATVSQDVTDFDASDLSVNGGQVVNFSGSGSSYTFGIRPGDGDPAHDPQPAGLVEVQIHEHQFSNNAASNYISRWYDPTASTTAQAGTDTPTLTIDSGPAEGEVVSTTTVTFAFTASEGATTECTFGTAFACGSPMTLGPLGDSDYTLTIVATNGAGTASTTVTRHFTVLAATSTASSTDSGSGSGSGSPSTPAPVTASGPVLPNGGGTPPNPNANNGQPVASGPTAPGDTTPTNPNPIIPTATTPAVQSVPAEGTAPAATPAVTTPAPTAPVVSVRGSSGSSAAAVTPAEPATPGIPDTGVAAPSVTDNSSPLSTDNQTAAVAQAPISPAVWFWGAIIILALLGIAWLFYRTA